jgi:hypothetical protein
MKTALSKQLSVAEIINRLQFHCMVVVPFLVVLILLGFIYGCQ